MNTYLSDNDNALRVGGLAIASQAVNDFIYASTTTQLARLAKTDYRTPFFNGSAWVMQPLGGINRCRVYNNAVQAISDSVATALTFNSETFDSAALHDTSSNTSRITVPTGGDGIWLFAAAVQWSGATGGVVRKLQLRKGGSAIKAEENVPPSAIVVAGHQVLALVDMAATEYMEAMVTQDSGLSMNVGTGADTGHWFSGIQVG